PNGLTTDQQIDNLNRVKKQTLPAPAASASRPEISFTYDGQGRLSSITDPRGNTTTYSRKGLGDTLQTSPDTGVTNFELDETGQIAYRINARDADASFLYDDLQRLQYVYNPIGYTRLFYDEYSTTPGSENYGRGRLTQVVEYLNGVVDSRVTLAYDQLGRVTRRCQIWGSTSTCTAADALVYRWGPATGTNAGRLLGLTYPSGRKVDYQYDAAGRISGLTTTHPGTSTAIPVLRNVQYTPLDVASGGHALKSFAFGDTASTQSYLREYDTSARLTLFTLGKGLTTNATAGTHTIDYDEGGIIWGINRFQSSWSSATYDYDNLNRLIGMSLSGGSLFSYSYDANGNRTLKTSYSTPTSYTYPATSNRLATVQVSSAASQAVTTDATGNITLDPAAPVGAVRFAYNDRTDLPYGRLISSEGPGARYVYQHNYFGQRTRKTGYNYTPTGTSTAIAPAP
ncbi:MAG: RHS repeat protein, partial [Rubrivivax sp.]